MSLNSNRLNCARIIRKKQLAAFYRSLRYLCFSHNFCDSQSEVMIACGVAFSAY